MRLRTLMLASVALVLAACSDVTGPPPPTSAPHPLRWARGIGTGSLVLGNAAALQTGSAPNLSVQSNPLAAPPSLSANQLTFWAYASQATSVEVDYQAADGTTQPYVTFEVPAGALLNRPDGSLILPGDSVQITMVLDTNEIKLQLEPTGLTFNPLIPAKLTIWYAGAGSDLNGDGLVNYLDSFIEQVLLRVWTQEDPTGPWIGLPAVQSLLTKSFSVNLKHFSGYAVSW